MLIDFDVFTTSEKYLIYHNVEIYPCVFIKTNEFNPIIRWKDRIFYAQDGCRSGWKLMKIIDVKYDPAKVPSISYFHVVRYLPVTLNIIYLLFENLVVRSAMKKLLQMRTFLVRYDIKRYTRLFWGCGKPALIWRQSYFWQTSLCLRNPKYISPNAQ